MDHGDNGAADQRGDGFRTLAVGFEQGVDFLAEGGVARAGYVEVPLPTLSGVLTRGLLLHRRIACDTWLQRELRSLFQSDDRQMPTPGNHELLMVKLERRRSIGYSQGMDKKQQLEQA